MLGREAGAAVVEQQYLGAGSDDRVDRVLVVGYPVADASVGCVCEQNADPTLPATAPTSSAPSLAGNRTTAPLTYGSLHSLSSVFGVAALPPLATVENSDPTPLAQTTRVTTTCMSRSFTTCPLGTGPTLIRGFDADNNRRKLVARGG